MTISRRHLLGTGAASLAAGRSGVQAAPRTRVTPARADQVGALQATLERYAALGDKASGGAGDTACGRWLEDELTAIGYACRHQPFEVPFFVASRATLAIGSPASSASASVIPQAPVTVTAERGLTAPLRLAARETDLSDAIAMVTLPFKRWASLSDPQVAPPLADAIGRGAAAVVLITTGPTGEAIALNVSARRPPFGRPVAILAPRDAAPFLAAAERGSVGTLTVSGSGGGTERRGATNLIARLDRRAAQTVVVSTPRSGWFGCAAERGSGLAVWLSLARSLAAAATTTDVNLEFLATSGHEYDYLGGEHYLAEAAPPPAATRLWVHIGASAAARDWHELGGRLLPLPSADAQRVLTATTDVIEGTRIAFRGVSGLEATYLADRTIAGGELVNVLAAGYRSTIGLYGGHRYFHTRQDDMRCVSGELVAPVARAFDQAIRSALA